ncbi:MAG: adhesion protein FadA [Leptotrichiaceae bacterium]|nr:adhesion protein FadA [Leptotrichiaceae bacterium]MBP7100425.1 adhesion protein FadA [Leptotrichiaceae bacterium]
MKKIAVLLVLLSAVSFADFAQVNAKYQKLEAEYSQLVNTENQEFNKLRASAQNASQELNQKQALKANIEERVSRLEGANTSKYFQSQYSEIVKEYKNVIKALDAEISSLSKVVDNYNAVESLKGGN